MLRPSSASLGQPSRVPPEYARTPDPWGLLQGILSAQRPIAYSVNVARITGDIKSALFLSQLIYWTRVGVQVEEHAGWVFKTREQWTQETDLTRYEQESARADLLRLGLIEEQRLGVPARNCYRVVAAQLGRLLAQLLRAEPVQLTLFDLRANATQVRALFGRNLAFYPVLSEMTRSTTVAIYLAKALGVQRHLMQSASAQRARTEHQHLPWDQDWFALSVRQFSEETGLTSAQQRDAKQKLCQLDLFEEATVTYPKRMTFTRIKLHSLAQQLQDFVVHKVSATPSGQHAGPGQGLMNALARGLQAPEAPQSSTSSPKWRTDSPGITSPKWRTVSAGTTSTKWRTVSRGNTSTTSPKPSSSLAESAKLDGGFSQASRGFFAGQSGVFSSTEGWFSQHQ